MDGPKHLDHQAVVPGHRVRLTKDRMRVGQSNHDEKDEAEIILIRNGDAIEAIEVICTCGRRTRLNCIF